MRRHFLLPLADVAAELRVTPRELRLRISRGEVDTHTCRGREYITRTEMNRLLSETQESRK
jgi:hypothetical protein